MKKPFIRQYVSITNQYKDSVVKRGSGDSLSWDLCNKVTFAYLSDYEGTNTAM